MVGRKRKPGARYPNGDLKPLGEPIVPAVWGRIRSDATKLFGDARFASEVGRLSFHREITELQASTAFRIGDIYSNFASAKELQRSARSPNYERGYGRSGDSDDIIRRWDIDTLLDDDPLKKKMRAAIAAQETFDALQKELLLMTPPQRQMIEALCVDDRHLTKEELWKVCELLDWLAGRIGQSASRRKAKRAEQNARLLRPKSKPAAVIASRATKRLPSPDHAVLRTILKRARPDMSDHDLAQACAIHDTLKDRELQRREKKRPLRGDTERPKSGEEM